MLFYSKQTAGFYESEIHGEAVPADAIELSAEEHAALLAGQAAGKRIVAGPDGRPELSDQPAPTASELAATAISRRAQLLIDSDWITLRSLETGATVPADWAAYRQALRDLPAQAGFPTSVTWPLPPQ